MNLNLSTSEPHFVFEMSQALKIEQGWFCIQNSQLNLNFQERKNLLHGLQVTAILVIQENSGGFLKTPCRPGQVKTC